MSYVRDERCEEFGLDRKKVAGLTRRISKAAREAHEMGLVVFGGSGAGTLRFNRSAFGGERTSVADLDGHFDGGDGGDSW